MSYLPSKPIEDSIKSLALKLEQGSDQQQRFGQQLVTIAAKLAEHRKATERPITAETLKQIRTGPNRRVPQFTPRRLPR